MREILCVMFLSNALNVNAGASLLVVLLTMCKLCFVKQFCCQNMNMPLVHHAQLQRQYVVR